MATEMDWSHDFCLSCDRQIAEGAYCSQACRLADLEKAGTSDPATPTNLSSSASSSSSYGSSSSGFYLPPAVNFAAYKTTSRHDSPPTSPNYYYATNAYFSQSASSQSRTALGLSSPPKRSLTPSSSRSSLSSVSSSQPTQGLSVQAANELRGYVSSFDQVRDLKRRLTMH
ncbi:hypothetical protein K432DRAFT_294808 [Lepidopterella palustris CBS 459.81]|uniref:Life-span regulatory factor domain-containing protein n=1 Tax=Lepidopterella palustris CBS 459.81 TaxID=1314670 RepID=A0A8E2JH27_9PEZI|nr:hypothetical protein K432DRAFT_294808 [Lepidopterella palustris CBS 459.81]